MNMDIQRQEVDQNYDAFQRILSTLLLEHRDQHALMRDRQVVGYFETAGAAYRAGVERYADQRFSIQEITDVPIDLGFFSHVGN